MRLDKRLKLRTHDKSVCNLSFESGVITLQSTCIISCWVSVCACVGVHYGANNGQIVHKSPEDQVSQKKKSRSY